MKRIRRQLILLLSISATLASAGPLDLLRTDSWVYEAVDQLKTGGYIRSLPYTSRPWTRTYAAELVREAVTATKDRAPGGLAGFYLERLEGEFAEELGSPTKRFRPHRPILPIPTDSGRTLDFDAFSRVRGDFDQPRGDTGNQSVSAGVTFKTNSRDWFTAYNRMELIVHRETMPNGPDSAGIKHVAWAREHYYKHRGLYQIPEAYFRFKIPWLELDLGRSYRYWGPGQVSSLLLSNSAPSLDQVGVTGTWRNFRVTGFTAGLSPWGTRNRYLSAQRAEVGFWDRFLFSANLFVVWSPESTQTRGFWGFVNPLIPIYPEMANTGHEDNLLAGFDAVLYLPKTKVYWQMMLDNFYAFDTLEWRRETPDAIATQLGLVSTPLPWLDVRYEYTAITNYTYYHRVRFIAFTNYDAPLGHVLGPDVQQHFLRLDFPAGRNGRASLLGTLTRRGIRNDGDWTNRTWLDPWRNIQLRQFPVGIVENTLSVGPQFTWHPSSVLQLTVHGAWNSIWNLHHERGVNTAGPYLNLGLAYRY